MWAFFEQRPAERVEVRPESSAGEHDDIILREKAGDVLELERLLSSVKEARPLALKGLKEFLNLQIDKDLQERVEKYTHDVALVAVSILKEEYAVLRKNDGKIADIEEQYSQQGTQKMFATHPVIPSIDPDPVLAAIMSHEARNHRERALKSLAVCMRELKNTGLINYHKDIEVPERPGEKKVYNLAEFAKYIRNILELSLGSEERTRETVNAN